MATKTMTFELRRASFFRRASRAPKCFWKLERGLAGCGIQFWPRVKLAFLSTALLFEMRMGKKIIARVGIQGMDGNEIEVGEV